MTPTAGAVEISNKKNNEFCGKLLTILSIILVILFLPLSIFACIVICKEYERVVIFRLGRLRAGIAKGPGIIWVLPCIDRYAKVDLRTVSFDVPAQDILTKDSVTVKLDAVIYYRFTEPLKVIIQVANIRGSTEMLAQTTLRNVAGTRTLLELLTGKDYLSKQIEVILDHATFPWGVKVERVEISDIKLPPQLQRAMAVEQEAERAARAKVAAAEGELKSATALKEASDIMATNKVAIQLRYLQTLNTIANEKTKNIIFPFPTDIIRAMLGISKTPSFCSVCKNEKMEYQKKQEKTATTPPPPTPLPPPPLPNLATGPSTCKCDMEVQNMNLV